MSGSYDPPERTGRPLTGQASSGATGDYTIYPDDPVTGPSQTAATAGYDDEMRLEADRFDDHASNDALAAPARARKGDRGAHGPIVPAGSVTGRSLTLVVSIMCFLACLTAGTVYLINKSASAWLRDVASEVTVQIEPIGPNASDIDRTITDVTTFLRRQPGITGVTPLSLASSTELLEPWLGQTEALKTLPVPRLIAVEVDPDQPPDLNAVGETLKAAFPNGVRLDDHRQWQNQIKTVTRTFALGGIAILILVAAATTAIIVSATRAAMASNRDIVEVLHFVGATDGFIAREFEKHFLRLGIKAGLIGAVSAMFVFLLLPWVTLLGGGAMSLIELERIAGGGALDLAGYVLLVIVVVVIAALCMLTSRYGVYRILNSRAD